MKCTLVLSVALLLLVWTGDASDHSPSDRVNLRRLPIRRANSSPIRRLNPAHSDTQTLKSAGKDPHSIPTSSENIRKHEEIQGDQTLGSPKEWQTRRMLAGRRPAQPGNPAQTGMVQDEGTPGARARLARVPSGSGSPNLLASFAGKNRVLVISAPHESDGYYRLMMSLLKPDVYCELAERHVQQIVMFHQEGEMGGKVRRITNEGKVIEERLDAALVPRLMNFLKLEKGKFGMVLLRKTLQVEERYPYPVRLEAVYEVIDQTPIRKLEKNRQKGFVQKCKGAGVEGQVEVGAGAGTPTSPPRVDTPVERRRRPVIPTLAPATTTTRPTTTTTTTTTTSKPTTTRATTTTTRATTTTTRSTTTTTRATTTTTIAPPTTQKPTKAQTTPYWMPAPRTTVETYYYPPTRDHRRGRQHSKVTPYPTSYSNYYTKAYTGRYRDNRTDKNNNHKQASITPTQQKPTKAKASKKTNGMKVLSNEYDGGRPTPGDPDEAEVEVIPTKKGKGKHDKAEKKKKKADKSTKKEKADKRTKATKEGKGENRNKKTGKKASKNQEKDDFQKPSKMPTAPKGSLATFLDYFESRRRLILITTPHEEGSMFIQQRDEYLEHVCEMAIRKASIITIFGTLTNSTMKIDHYQLEHDKPMKGLREEDLVNQDLIIELRKEFGMTYDDFFMVLTDFDMKVKQYYEVPIAMKAVFDYIDTFSSRIKEMEQQKREGVTCKKEDKPRSLENFLSRFRWRRRLFIISAPNDEEWAYQQQLYALTSQACNLGLRHVSVLKLVGVDAVDMGGVLELYPINGSATVEREGLSASLVKDIRNYFQISPEYFSMLLVGKDGNVKSWYPSPMWSMAIIYDLVDSMQLRRQEMAIQQSLGMRCPEDEYGGYGYHHRGYEDGYQEGYHQGYGY